MLGKTSFHLLSGDFHLLSGETGCWADAEPEPSMGARQPPRVPFCFCKKSMVLCSIVDLSILRGWPWPCSIVQSSLMRTLNWSLLFFSDLFRDALGDRNINAAK